MHKVCGALNFHFDENVATFLSNFTKLKSSDKRWVHITIQVTFSINNIAHVVSQYLTEVSLENFDYNLPQLKYRAKFFSVKRHKVYSTLNFI